MLCFLSPPNSGGLLRPPISQSLVSLPLDCLTGNRHYGNCFILFCFPSIPPNDCRLIPPELALCPASSTTPLPPHGATCGDKRAGPIADRKMVLNTSKFPVKTGLGCFRSLLMTRVTWPRLPPPPENHFFAPPFSPTPCFSLLWLEPPLFSPFASYLPYNSPVFSPPGP